MKSRILLGTIFGAIGGFIGFLLQERFVTHDAVLENTFQDLAKLGALVGCMIGLAVGCVEGVAVNSNDRLIKGAILGFIIGLIGGVFGAALGNWMFGAALFGKDPRMLANSSNVLDFTQLVIARALGWTFLGALPGLAAGAATLSPKRAFHGLGGGLIGGFLGGFLFDLIGSVIAHPIQAVAAGATSTARQVEIGGPSRAIGFTLIGALTGLFIGLVEELFKQAWVRVLAGKNEGKDYIISKPLTVLGRDERADVPLFGDMGLAPQHAAIRMENGRHLLMDGGSQIGSVVNGQRVTGQPQLLRDGDMIQLGQVRLLFREKATASKVGRPVQDAPKAAQTPGAVSMPSHLCPFCGAAKDARGGCLCTVPGAGAPAATAAPTGFTNMGGGMPMSGGANPAFGAAPSDYMSQPGGFSDPSPMGSGFGTGVPSGYDSGGYGSPLPGGGGTLVALDGPYAGQSFPLAGVSITIGRAPDNNIPMPADVTISRRHAHINEENGSFVLYDDGSSNGTFVNNVRVQMQVLSPGDQIQFGGSKYRLQ